jgi:hypothetical protein
MCLEKRIAWRIDTFAEGRGHEFTTRNEVFKDKPDRPRPNEEYLKIQMGARPL